jgi:hypothetical protein
LGEEPTDAERKPSDEVEGLLVATTCSNHRRAERRWTLELQVGAMGTFTEHAGLCRETVRRHLPENDLKPWTAQPMRRSSVHRPQAKQIRSHHWLNKATRRSPSPPDGDLADDPLWLSDPLVEALGMTSFPIMCQRAPSRFPVDRSGPRHDQISIGLSAPTAWFQPTCSFGPEPLMPPWGATRMSPDKHPQLRARQGSSPSKDSSPSQSA